MFVWHFDIIRFVVLMVMLLGGGWAYYTIMFADAGAVIITTIQNKVEQFN